MAISTYKTYLMVKDSSDYKKLIDIKDFPDLGGAPETIEVTTLSDKMKTYIAGLQDSKGLEFTVNYTASDYEKLSGYSNKDNSYAIYFGDDGSNGKFTFNGDLYVYVVGAGTNAAVEMKITIVPSTEITFSSSAA